MGPKGSWIPPAKPVCPDKVRQCWFLHFVLFFIMFSELCAALFSSCPDVSRKCPCHLSTQPAVGEEQIKAPADEASCSQFALSVSLQIKLRQGRECFERPTESVQFKIGHWSGRCVFLVLCCLNDAFLTISRLDFRLLPEGAIVQPFQGVPGKEASFFEPEHMGSAHIRRVRHAKIQVK